MSLKDKLKDAINKGQERARQASRKGKGTADQPRKGAEKLDEELRRRGEPPRGR